MGFIQFAILDLRFTILDFGFTILDCFDPKKACIVPFSDQNNPKS